MLFFALQPTEHQPAHFMDRHDTARTFRSRLLSLLDRSGDSRASFAERAGINRSTLTQLLATDADRLPRAEIVIAIAELGDVTCDWLLGRSDDEQQSPELLSNTIEVADNAASPADQRLLRWHQEASGYTIRYVPTTLPDIFKTERVMAYEGARSAGADVAKKLHYTRAPEAVMEICSNWQTIRNLARGAGVWRDLDTNARREQLQNMMTLVDELYPTVRWSLFDGVAHYSAPITVFGSQRAVIYVGELYFVFNAKDHIRVLMSRFDNLVKTAVVQPTSVTAFLHGEIAAMGTK